MTCLVFGLVWVVVVGCVCVVVPFRCLWFGVINHVLVGDSGVVFRPSDKLLMIHGFLVCGTRFVAA